MSLRWTALLIGAAALLAAGAGAAYVVMRPAAVSQTRSDHAGSTMVPAPAGAQAAAAGDGRDVPLPDVVVTLSPEAVQRAGIKVASVGTRSAAAGLRLPGVVEPNAYRQVVVTPLVSGRLTGVHVQLGDQVRPGQPMARIFSPELSDAHSRYTSARAELQAHERELQRTERLVEIGAASRQELERIHAEHTAQTAVVQSARSRLELLGVPAAALDATSGEAVGATASVLAPIGGIVTERLANVGLNVDPSSKLFTVVDLSTVWVVAELYEKDFSRVDVGAPATVMTSAYPDRILRGRVSYIDPQVSGDTRTARLRVEIQNTRNELRLGMYADVELAGGDAAPTPAVPRAAVQNVGDRQVVYLVNPREPGKFTERQVRLGSAGGDQVEVLSGVQAGEVVVTEGSFFVRAERERLGLRASAPASSLRK